MAPHSSVSPFGHKAKSSLGLKYPSLRDHPIHSSEKWLEGKRLDDGAEDLWRVHDSLYDLTDFVKFHPGGSMWLELTKGTDITEAFETHHHTKTPDSILTTYFIRKTATPRNSAYTFKDGGFYRTLKENVQPVLQTIPRSTVNSTKLMTDSLLAGTFLFAILSAAWQSYTFGIVSAFLLAVTVIAAHNYFHQKDNLRMYYFDLSLLSSKEWRVSHVLSHHLHTNTINDLEIATLEPFFQYLPNDKHFVVRFGSWLYSPIVYTFIYFGSFVRRIIGNLLGHTSFEPATLIPVILPTTMYLMTESSLFNVLHLWLFILAVSSFIFGLIGLNGTHHHPHNFHDGDAPREDRDWGLMQLDAVMDRVEVTGNPFLVLTTFGDHALHHLFPTLDHAVLKLLYPVFNETCKQFGVELRMRTSWEMLRGQFMQLARTKPNVKVPSFSDKSK